MYGCDTSVNWARGPIIKYKGCNSPSFMVQCGPDPLVRPHRPLPYLDSYLHGSREKMMFCHHHGILLSLDNTPNPIMSVLRKFISSFTLLLLITIISLIGQDAAIALTDSTDLFPECSEWAERGDCMPGGRP